MHRLLYIKLNIHDVKLPRYNLYWHKQENKLIQYLQNN